MDGGDESDESGEEPELLIIGDGCIMLDGFGFAEPATGGATATTIRRKSLAPYKLYLDS